MKQIPTYKAEAGLVDKIRTQASVSYLSPAQVAPKQELTSAGLLKALAENKNQIDLFYLKSVLASIGWNLNDDVFDKKETWIARATPEDKPFNLEHNPRNIVGHITGNFAMAADGTILSDNLAIDELPDQFDIATTAVLYRFTNSEDADLEKQMQSIIAEIQEGKWYVSMEALFADFDYAVIDEQAAKATVITRNEESAFLTKHLRAYGGDGKFQGKRVGRLLRDIVFAGKGLVRRPANPGSIIFANTTFFKENVQNKITAGYINMSNDFKSQERTKMAGELNLELLQSQIKNLESSLAAANSQNKDLEKRLKEMDEQRVTARITTLESDIKARDEKVTALNAQVETEVKARQSAEAKVKETAEALAKASDELTKVKTEQTKQGRINKWMSHTGASVEDAGKAVSKAWVEKLSETEFDEYLAEQPKAKAEDADAKAKAEEEAAAKAKAEAEKNGKVTTDDIKNAEKEKTPPLATAGVNNVEETRASLSKFIRKNYLGGRRVQEKTEE